MNVHQASEKHDASYVEHANEAITIRPIRLSDQEMEAEFIRHLSPDARHFRFLGGVGELPDALLRSLCDVDRKHSMAFVATIVKDGKDVEIGVSRFAPNSEDDVREMAVTVTDDWQKQGIGTMLAKHLIEFAKGHGVHKLYSVDMADNIAMHELARDLGMTARRDPTAASQVIYSLSL